MDQYVWVLLKPFVDSLTNLYELVRKAKVRRNNDAAEYFEDLASAMTGVLEGLRARRVPRESGHEMEILIRAFPERTKGVLRPEQSAEVKDALHETSEIAKTLDKQVFFHLPSTERDREQQLAQIERIVGDCRGLAGVLRRGT
jgi:hypothetical protein